MTEGAVFDWRSLGKADYAQACALVASIPGPLRDQLKNGERELLCRITFLVWRFAQHSGRGAGYCWPSASYLATVLRRSERTVHRYLGVLRASGLLTWKRRTTAHNTWTSNLYLIGKAYLASLFARCAKKSQQNQAMTKMAHNDLKREYKAGDSEEARTRLEELRQKARLKRSVWPMGPPIDEPTDTWGEEAEVSARKDMLRRQAEHLKGLGL